MSKFWAGMVLLCALATPAGAADGDAKAPAPPAKTAEKSTPIAAPAAKSPSLALPSSGKVDPATAQCEIAPGTGDSEIEALKRQVNALQLQLEAQSSPAAAPKPDVDYTIRIKNLPAGSYRERCFSCMTGADEDGERILLCTCPTSNDSFHFDRLSLTLSMCSPGEEISFCANMLMCGPCKLNSRLQQELPVERDSGPDSKAGQLEQFLNK